MLTMWLSATLDIGPDKEQAIVKSLQLPRWCSTLDIKVPSLLSWTQANAIHRYFMNLSIDKNSKWIYVGRKNTLRELHAVCNDILKAAERTSEWAFMARSELPTEAYLGFGSTDYDDNYLSILKFTRDHLQVILDCKALDNCYFSYEYSL